MARNSPESRPTIFTVDSPESCRRARGRYQAGAEGEARRAALTATRSWPGAARAAGQRSPRGGGAVWYGPAGVPHQPGGAEGALRGRWPRPGLGGFRALFQSHHDLCGF